MMLTDSLPLCSIPLLRPTALLIEREPNNLQAQSLNQLIEKGVARGECFDSHTVCCRISDSIC